MDDFGQEFFDNMSPVNESATPKTAYSNDLFEKPKTDDATDA